MQNQHKEHTRHVCYDYNLTEACNEALFYDQLAQMITRNFDD